MDFSKTTKSKNFMDRTALYGLLMDRVNKLGPILRKDLSPEEHVMMMLTADEVSREQQHGYPAPIPVGQRPKFRK